MFTCAHCGASLQSARQTCARCNKGKGDSSLVLPTLQGFGEEVFDDGVKTLLSPRSVSDLDREHEYDEQHPQDDVVATSTFVSPIPSIPKQRSNASGFSDQKSFLTDSKTEVIRGKRSAHSLDDLETESMDFTLSEDDHLSHGQIDAGSVSPAGGQAPNKGMGQLELKTSTTPPPIPPPTPSLGGAYLRGVENPFSPKKLEARRAYFALWFSAQGQSAKVNLGRGGPLVHPLSKRKSGTIKLMRDAFQFEERFGAEVWRPLARRERFRQSLTLRSVNAVIRLVEMTIEQTEVISQIAIAVWQLKPSQEQVYYGAFNLFSGVSRIGGGQCEISLPFVQTPGPLFTIECDPNGDVWSLPNGGQELWSLVQPKEPISYGSVLATQGQLFSVIQTKA